MQKRKPLVSDGEDTAKGTGGDAPHSHLDNLSETAWENYAISRHLRKLLLNFFIEISHLDEFQAIAVQMFQQTCQVFFDDFYKGVSNGLGFEFMLENGLENLDYTHSVIERASSMEPRRDDPYSSILGGARSLEIGGNSRAKSH